MILKYMVKEKDNDLKIRYILKNKLKISDNFLVKLKKYKKIFLNDNNNIYLDMNVKKGDIIKVYLDFDEDNSNIFPTKMNLKILYEDDFLIILDKPTSIPTIPTLNHYKDSLSNGLKYYYDTINVKRKIRPLNRLDKDTSGIVIFAKNEYICHNLNILKKEYLAIVNGKLEGHDIIDMRIGGKNADGIKRLIDEKNGKEAITEYYNLKNLKMNDRDITLIKCIIHTGRTHQIRLHMSSISHDILGDKLYGKETSNINRLMLHAYKVTFYHPIKNKKIVVKSLLPEDMMKIIKYE